MIVASSRRFPVLAGIEMYLVKDYSSYDGNLDPERAETLNRFFNTIPPGKSKVFRDGGNAIIASRREGDDNHFPRLILEERHPASKEKGPGSPKAQPITRIHSLKIPPPRHYARMTRIRTNEGNYSLGTPLSYQRKETKQLFNLIDRIGQGELHEMASPPEDLRPSPFNALV